jgi:hypothetical protein
MAAPSHSILSEIRDTCAHVVSVTEDVVAIDTPSIKKWVASFATENVEEARRGVEWDASGWHYCADSTTCGPLTAQYVFVLDSLNFCFWPTPGLEYDTLATSLKLVLELDPHAFDADRLSVITCEVLSGWFAQSGYTLPLLNERVKRLQELGRALASEFNGLALEVIRHAGKSAARLVALITSRFQGQQFKST